MAVETTQLGYQKPDENDPLRNGDNIIAANAELSQTLFANARGRLALLEQSAGFSGDGIGLTDDAVSPLISATSVTRGLMDDRYANQAATIAALAGKSNTGHGHGFAEITGVVSTAQLPPLAINETFAPASQAAMLALVAQRGDMAIRTDNGKTYVLATDSPGTLADWKEVMAAGQVQSVAGRTGVVVLAKSDVGLSAVDNVADASKPVSAPQAAALAPINLAGAYSARPAFGTVKAGTLYFATDTLETYRAMGAAGSAATSWATVGPGGTELAYAESLTTYSVVSQTPADVPGVTITFTPGERPVKLEFGALMNIKGTPGEVVIRIMDGATTVKEMHFVSPLTSFYVEGYGSIRKSYAAGVSKTLKIMALQTISPVVTDIVGAATWPIWMRASSL